MALSPPLYSALESHIQEPRSQAVIFRFEFYPEEDTDLVAEGTANLVAIDRDWRASPVGRESIAHPAFSIIPSLEFACLSHYNK